MTFKKPRRSQLMLVALLGAGCSRSGEAGVHVVVTIDSSISGGADFDHITVTAQGGGKTAIACFFPPDAPSRQAAVVDAGSDDPCVDLLPTGTLSPPTATEWDLSGAPRSVNFVFPEGVTPSIVAYAALGESGPVAAASVTAPTATLDFPDTVVTLLAATVTPGECAMAYAPAGVESSHLVCDAPVATDCLEATASAGRAPTVPCVAETARVIAGAQSCGGEIANMVWRDDATRPESSDCASVVVVGRFVRCASGSPTDPEGCPVTTDCTAPPTLVGYANTDLAPQVGDISCLPPSLVTRAVVVSFANSRRSSDTRAFPFLIASPPAGDPAVACFFDVKSVFVASSSEIACPSLPLDAGLAIDAGDAPLDAGGGAETVDASALEDAGEELDAGHEAGEELDAGHDAGRARDAGRPGSNK